MCRSIKPLFNFEPMVTEDEVRAAALQFVRKISGTRAPSKANAAAFDAAVDHIAEASDGLLRALETSVAPKDRAIENEKLRERRAKVRPA